MRDHVDAVIALCDKIESLDLTDTERAILYTLVDLAVGRVEAADEVQGYGVTDAAPAGLRESIGVVIADVGDHLERRLRFDARRPPGSGYQALPELDANGA